MTTPENTLRVGIPSPGPSFRGALASRDFSLLFVGQLSSEIGNGLVQLALPWLVLQLTGSAFQLGLAYFVQFLPMLLFGLIGGVFVDRWDRRVTIFVVDAIRAVAFLSVGAIYYFDALTVEHLYTVIFVEAALANFFNPARAALMPNLVKPEHLRPANSLMEVSRHIGFLIAPPVGGVLVALVGPAALMLVDGVSFLISALTVFAIRRRPERRERAQTDGWRHAFVLVASQTAEGLRAIGRARLLQVAVLLGFSLNLIVAPIQVLLPLFVRDVKEQPASYFGLLVGGLLFGLITGSLAAPANARRFGIGRLAIASVLVLGVVICVAAWPPALWPPFVAMVIAGLAIGSLNVAQTSLLQGATTDEDRGRVSATYYTFTLGIRPFGFLVIGAFAEVVDIRILFVALGVLALVVGLALVQMEEVREAH
jgi:MFS family permease